MNMDWAQQPLTRGEFAAYMGTSDNRFALAEGRFARIDGRFEQVDQRFEQIDQRFEKMDRRLDLMTGEMIRMREEMVTKKDLKSIESKIDRLYAAVLDIAEKGKVYDTKALTHADQLFGHEARLGDHEKRIKRLESGEH